MSEKTESADNIIQVSNLYKSYGEIKAVDGISFSVKRGELFTFLGLNGAGKSTTINILCSILKKDSGTVIIDGLNLDEHAQKIKEKIGIVFQGSVLDRTLSVKDNLESRMALYRVPRKVFKQRIEKSIELLNLKDILKRNYENLSGGQRRRVDIARALLHEPQILFLDEPTTGLDPNTRISVWQTVEQLGKSTGLTVFLTTHYMEEVMRADNVIIIDKGRIAAEGTPDGLKEQYVTDYLRVVNSECDKISNFLNAQNKKYSYRNNSYFIEFGSCQEALKFKQKHEKHGWTKDFEILKGDMDDVFLKVTGKLLEDKPS